MAAQLSGSKDDQGGADSTNSHSAEDDASRGMQKGFDAIHGRGVTPGRDGDAAQAVRSGDVGARAAPTFSGIRGRTQAPGCERDASRRVANGRRTATTWPVGGGGNFDRYFADLADNAAKHKRAGHVTAAPSAADRMAALRQRLAIRRAASSALETGGCNTLGTAARRRNDDDATAHAASSNAWHSGPRPPAPDGSGHLRG